MRVAEGALAWEGARACGCRLEPRRRRRRRAMPSAEQLAAAHRWLADRGARVSSVALRDAGEGRGAGVVATVSVSAGAAVASFPLALARAGAALAPEAPSEAADHRVALMAWLAAQRRMGSASGFAPWVAALPQCFAAPFFWDAGSAARLLGGTSLASAVPAQRAWADKSLEAARPLFAAMLEEGGSEGGDRSELTAAEFRWAFGVFWSRAMGLPVGEDDAGVVEAILPGVDFCNHRGKGSNARWELLGADGGAEADGDGEGGDHAEPRYGLVATRDIDEGEEICISYGDANAKSNEELLFLYGFVEEDEARDALALPLPLGSETHATALREIGLLPRVVLRRPSEGGCSVELSEMELASLCVLAAEPERAARFAIGEATIDEADQERGMALLAAAVRAALDAMEEGSATSGDDAATAALPSGAAEAAARYRSGASSVARSVLNVMAAAVEAGET